MVRPGIASMPLASVVEPRLPARVPRQYLRAYAATMQPTKPGEAALPAEHPLVRTHAETGRKVLYISDKTITRRFVGMTDEESDPVLSFLREHATRPEFTCQFRWAPGSLAIWDNRCVQHIAINDYYGHRRVMHRITIAGEATA